MAAASVLDMSAANTNISLNGDWSNSGNVVPGASSTVTFTDNGVTSNINGSSSFCNFKCETAGKSMVFEAGKTQTIGGTLTLDGQALGTEITITSSVAGTRFTFNVTGGPQNVSYIKLKDSNSSSNDITADDSQNDGNNDDLEAVPHWIFGNSVYLDTPVIAGVIDNQPTLIGHTTAPNIAFKIKGVSGAATVFVASGNSDDNGEFRVVVDSATLLDIGPNNLRPFVGSNGGPPHGVTVVAATDPDEVPEIDSPVNNSAITTNPFSVSGFAEPGVEVRLEAVGSDDNYVLNCGSVIADAGTGAYTLSCDAVANGLKAGTNTLTVTTYDALGNAKTTSKVITVTFTDPFGIVFDSVSNNPIGGAVVTIYYDSDLGPGRNWILAQAGVHIAAGEINPQTTAADGFYGFNCIDGDYYITTSAVGYKYPTDKLDPALPAGRVIVTPGSRGEVFTVAGVVIQMDHPMDALETLIKVTKTANKKEARVGDIVTYTVTLENVSSGDIEKVYLEDSVPAGFKYLKTKVRLDGSQLDDPVGTRPLRFSVGDIQNGGMKTLKYQMVVGAGVSFGKYVNRAFAKYIDSSRISNIASATVKIIPDPLFDMGTVVGKVYDDANSNGWQDPGELPVGNARIFTEDGTIITTDRNGMFHLQGIIPGRHLFRLDESSLPRGAYPQGKKVKLVEITPGMLTKVNFGVTLPEGLDKTPRPYLVEVEKGAPEPRLNAGAFSLPMKIDDNGVFSKPVEFRIFTNYGMFIDRWRLEITDRRGGRPVKVISGKGDSLNRPIYWDGTTDGSGGLVMKDDDEFGVPGGLAGYKTRTVYYRLKAYDASGKEDITDEKTLVIKIADKGLVGENEDKGEELKTREEWFRAEISSNSLDKQRILVQGETLKIKDIAAGISTLKIRKDAKTVAEINVASETISTAKDIINEGGRIPHEADEPQTLDIILPRGEYQIESNNADAGYVPLPTPARRSLGEGGSNVLRPTEQVAGPQLSGLEAPCSMPEFSTQTIKIGDDHLFLVGLADGKAGWNFNKGNIEPVGDDDKFQEGLWSEGKLAYHLEGKMLGKYVVSSSLDTTRAKKELFEDIDPDKYYPVYGDGATINKASGNTQGMLYLAVEWDKSKVKWGNYEAAIDGPELAQYSRTLYGGLADVQTLSTSKYGDPNTKVMAFKALAQQKAAHNEFLSTGGSLYYLKNDLIVEGSDKVKIEVRDRITGLILASEEMKEGVDYRIDYDYGRIMFWESIPFMMESSSIISNDLLNGNPIYIVVDYEYEVKDKMKEGVVGGRVKQNISDHLTVGSTYVKEEQVKEAYELRGGDAVAHIGELGDLGVEYAESTSESVGNFISTDGGFDFTSVSLDDKAAGKAYGFKEESQLLDKALTLGGYYKSIDKDFSSVSTVSQQGKDLMGFGADWDASKNTAMKLSHDIQKLSALGNAQTKAQVGANAVETTEADIVQKIDRLELTGAYRHQAVEGKLDQYDSETNRKDNIAAGKAEYEINKALKAGIIQQVSLGGEKDAKTTGQLTSRINENVSTRIEHVVATEGSASRVSVKASPRPGISVTGSRTLSAYNDGRMTNESALSAAKELEGRTGIRTTLSEVSSNDGENTKSVTMATRKKVGKETEIGYDRTYSMSQKDSLFDDTRGIGDNTTGIGTGMGFLADKDENNYKSGESNAEGSKFIVSHGRMDDLVEGFYSKDVSRGRSSENISRSSSFGLARDSEEKRIEGKFSKQFTDSARSVSETNIYGLSGEANDRWAAGAKYGRGRVSNLDGSRDMRSIGGLDLAYLDKDLKTREKQFAASEKLEVRYDDRENDRRQLLSYTGIEGKVNPDVTVFVKADLSRTELMTTHKLEAEHKLLTLGGALRPIENDRLNLLAKYDYVEGKKPDSQSSFLDLDKQKAHVLSGEYVFDIIPLWSLSEKMAARYDSERVLGFDYTDSLTWLWGNRLDVEVFKDWHLRTEYRVLGQKQAEDFKHTCSLEVARDIGDIMQVAVGYNITDFIDNLTNLDYTVQGPYFRVDGIFFDQTREEIERIKVAAFEKAKNAEIERIMLKRFESDREDQHSLNLQLSRADTLFEEGELENAEKIYTNILLTISGMRTAAGFDIESNIDKEERINEMYEKANKLYADGNIEEAEKAYRSCLMLMQAKRR
ncbi:MAG: DUF11 domain-containing protein [Candidatus Omnitrophica bacterium]|nr:DUF11 domain-containing protein [Candidatus Omnitrophota bacterium]